MSAYLLYQNAMREQFKALNPGMTFGQLAKYTSAMYSELPPSEKEAWVARAEADKARYLHELASYVPPTGYDAKGDAIVSPVGSKGGRKGKPEKDANAPKRNMSAYLLYQNAMREQFKRENPGMVRLRTDCLWQQIVMVCAYRLVSSRRLSVCLLYNVMS